MTLRRTGDKPLPERDAYSRQLVEEHLFTNAFKFDAALGNLI